MDESAIFLEALEHARPEERAAFLDHACAGDDDLRHNVEMLLKANARAGTFLNQPAVHPLETADDESTVAEAPGSVIGPYKLLEQIGEGGFGVVFMAEQQQPVRRKVALKVLKPGMDTRQVIARFEAERQALALMEHPNIARVLDAGTTRPIADCRMQNADFQSEISNLQSAIGAGRPYFVMELVRGVSITEYCDQNSLPIHERLKLFVNVCQAVQHAHQKGIIHRDIKPSNVLVTLHDGTPVVKVIDFGIAKAMDQRLTDKTLLTGFAQMIGTPLYMSPEQAALSGLDVDTRSDIYSLGVLLYELLTGTTPFDRERFQEVDYDEMRRIIREEEPPRPSTRISTLGLAATTLSTKRHSDPKRLRKMFCGELDWIVMKCLEKDRNRRYETVSRLAEDVERYLHDRPVLACPPSRWYRLRKLARRNKAPLAVAGLVLLSLVSLGGGIGWVAHDHAARELVLEREVTAALRESESFYRADRLPEAFVALKQADGLLAGGGGEQVRERVRQWRNDLEMAERLEGIRDRQAQWRQRAYQVNQADADYAEAFRHYGIDVETLDPAEAAERIAARPIRVTLVTGLDHWLQVRKESVKAPEKAWMPLLTVLRAADPDEYRDRIRTALMSRDMTTLLQLTEPKLLARLPVATALYAADVLRWNGNSEQAVELMRQIQRLHPDDFWANWLLGNLITSKEPRQWNEAQRYFSAALAIRPKNVELHIDLGAALRNLGQLERAIAEFRAAIVQQPDFADGHRALADALHAQGRLAEAIEAYRKAAALAPDWAAAQWDLGMTLCANGQYAETLTQVQRVRNLGPNYPDRSYPTAKWIPACERLAALEARLPEFLSGTAQPASASQRLDLAQMCHGRGYWLQAARWYAEAITAQPALFDDQYSSVRYNAARAAAQAATGPADGLPPPNEAERAQLRRHALEWLQSELTARRRLRETAPAQFSVRALEDMRRWQTDPALAGVRRREALQRLPAVERPDWERLWQGVEEMRQKAASTVAARNTGNL
jgi:serine/threonine protein kinase/Tfp pilus assembly protein PilF